jgi:hypothetical protein
MNLALMAKKYENDAKPERHLPSLLVPPEPNFSLDACKLLRLDQAMALLERV